jgi:phage repressor protein C with HTH and peptisase S24 domain
MKWKKKSPPMHRAAAAVQARVRVNDGHEGFVERLKLLVMRAGSARALAGKAGVSSNTISLWLRDSEPGRDKLVDLANAADVSVEWLASGRGRMDAGQLPEGYVVLPAIPTASHSQSELLYLAFHEQWIAALPGSPRRAELIQTWAVGDAMAPTIQAGDVVVMHFSDHEIRDGIFSVLEIDEEQAQAKGDFLIRRVQRKADGAHVILCDNPKYPVIETVDPKREPREGGRTYHRVVWAGGMRR